VCLEIAKRYEIALIEIGVEKDRVHFLLQSVPSYSLTRIMKIVKSITAREIFKLVPRVKKQLWGGQFWTKEYLMSTVGRYGDEDTIKNYVKKQGRPEKDYKKLHSQELQLELF
jgi:putative transposase